MKIVLLAFLKIISFFVQAQTSTIDCKQDTSRVAMLPFIDYRAGIFDSTYRSAILDKQEYCAFQKILIAFFNDKVNSPLNLIYKDHKIQYISVVDTNGKKFVLINAFCKNYGGFKGTSWKNELVRPSDGGPCYFLGVVDLKEKTIKDLWFNGE